MISPVTQKSVVHVIDDDDSLRKAIGRLLRAAGYEVCSYSSAGDFVLSSAPRSRGCVLLDVRMPGPDGLDLQKALAREERPLPVIFLTGHGDIPSSVRAMKAGAIDFLTKPVKREILLGAVRTALARDQAQTRSSEERHELQARLAQLTPREDEVFQLVVAGKLNKQIAGELGLAERTVKAHRAEVMRKMRATSLAELVHFADRLETAVLP